MSGKQKQQASLDLSIALDSFFRSGGSRKEARELASASWAATEAWRRQEAQAALVAKIEAELKAAREALIAAQSEIQVDLSDLDFSSMSGQATIEASRKVSQAAKKVKPLAAEVARLEDRLEAAKSGKSGRGGKRRTGRYAGDHLPSKLPIGDKLWLVNKRLALYCPAQGERVQVFDRRHGEWQYAGEIGYGSGALSTLGHKAKKIIGLTGKTGKVGRIIDLADFEGHAALETSVEIHV